MVGTVEVAAVRATAIVQPPKARPVGPVDGSVVVANVEAFIEVRLRKSRRSFAGWSCGAIVVEAKGPRCVRDIARV